ncbi:MAG: type II secretion system protein GspG [Myxococcales bacterium]|nr:type II secretion system protein GspG [Myxococcales bacterium]
MNVARSFRPWTLAIIAALSLGAGFGLGWWRGQKNARAPFGEPRDMASWYESRFDRIPQSAFLAGAFDADFLLDQLIDRNLGLFPVSATSESLRASLAGASVEYFGVDFTRVDRALFWITADDRRVVVFLEGDLPGELVGEVVSGTPGLLEMAGDVFAARVKGGLLLGTRDGVADGLAVESGKGIAIAGDAAAKAAHAGALTATGGGAVIMTFRPSASELGEIAPFQGLSGGAVAFRSDGSTSVVATGTASALDGLKAQADMAIAIARGALGKELGEAKAKAKESPMEDERWAVLALTFASAKLDDLLAYAKLERQGDVLRLDAAGPAGALAMYLGALGSLSFRSFSRVATRAQAATDQLTARRLSNAVELYRVEKNALPEKLTDLAADGSVPKADLVDQWGNAFGYEKDPTRTSGYRICSGGRDGMVGTDDDLCAPSEP